jgi:hypothetical protein
LGAHDGLDAVGDEVARLERVGHPVRPVRDAVRHADRVEAQPDHAALLHRALSEQSDVKEVHVARVALVPDGRDADLRLAHPALDLAHIRRVQLRLPRALRDALCDDG